jgi:drug/metabolite transporter (DMT)-like permease
VFFLGVIMGGLGYAAGARAAETMSGMHVISWALIIGLPITIPLSWWFAPQWGAIPAKGWWCFAYLAIMSQYIGFFFWYRGLQMGSISKVSQVQLLQMFMTISVSAVLVGEPITLLTGVAAALTVAIIAVSKKL